MGGEGGGGGIEAGGVKSGGLAGGGEEFFEVGSEGEVVAAVLVEEGVAVWAGGEGQGGGEELFDSGEGWGGHGAG